MRVTKSRYFVLQRDALFAVEYRLRGNPLQTQRAGNDDFASNRSCRSSMLGHAEVASGRKYHG